MNWKDYFVFARARAQRRKSPWNFALAFFSLPVMTFFWLGSCILVWKLHVQIYPDDAGRFYDVTSQPGLKILSCLSMVLGPFIPSLILAMIISNAIFWRIPPAKKVFDREAKGHPGTDYDSSQRDLSRLLVLHVVIGFILSIIGVITL